MSFSCRLLGHSKKYVGVKDIEWVDTYGSLKVPCAHGYCFINNCDTCKTTVQIARWVCACGAAGETYIKRGTGIFAVHFGKLVPDEKRWANA